MNKDPAAFVLTGSVMLALIVAKIMGFCTLNWWLVLMPFYILPVAVAAILMAIWILGVVVWVFAIPIKVLLDLFR